MKNKLSTEQKKAAEFFKSDVAVLAGAGSGKTTLLVERFIQAVLAQKKDPLSILAVTFTEKAAGEIKERLVQAFEERELWEERRKIEEAYIGTIHSFCARVLRENPIEAVVDPAFRILSEGESQILMNRVLDELFEEETQNDAWIEILSDYGETEIRQSFKKLHSQRRAYANDGALTQIRRFDKEEKQAKLTILKSVELLQKALAEAATKTDEKIKENSAKLIEVFTENTEVDWKGLSAVLEIGGDLSLQSKKVKEETAFLKEAVQEWASLAAARLSEKAKQGFLRVYFKFEEKLNVRKKEKALFDFDDLLLKAYELFTGNLPKQKAVFKRYQDYFSHILVDEYQDTSFLQHQILNLLRKKANFFAVGDLQQSIYGFRQAEPVIFKEIAGREDVARFRLSGNYRSRPEILNFVNKLFADKTDPEYFVPLNAEKAFGPKKSPAIEVICVDKSHEEVQLLEKARIVEARLLARRIRSLTESGEFEYRDIAILLRGTTASAIYEKALQDDGIPFYSVKGKFFFEKQEIKDLTAYLQILENPNQDIPLAAILRSPFVTVSDEALFWLAQSVKKDDNKAPLWRAIRDLDKAAELSETDKNKILNFRKKFFALRRAKSTWRLSELIERILESGDYEAKLLTESGGRQKLANVRKLLEMSREIEEKGIFGVDDFLDFLKHMEEEGGMEAEAKIEALDQDTVKIFTIHAAKGLEFPCVILADMGQEKKKSVYGAFSFSREWGFGLKARNPVLFDQEADYAYRKSSETSLEKEKEEDLRLLYVAMTRAKEKLILSGCDGGENWMSLVASVCEIQKERFFNEEAPASARREMPNDGLWESPVRLKAIQERFVLPAKTYDHYEDLTVTDLLGHEEEPEYEFEMREDEDLAPRNEYGTVFHRILEYLIRNEIKTLSMSASFWKMAEFLPEAQQKELRDSVKAFWTGGLAREILASKSKYSELPFIYKTKHGILKGQIDLVYQNKKGGWVILDYKTNQLDKKDKRKLQEFYRLQLEVYAFIFYKLHGEAPLKGQLYFSFDNSVEEFAYNPSHFNDMESELQTIFTQKALERQRA